MTYETDRHIPPPPPPPETVLLRIRDNQSSIQRSHLFLSDGRGVQSNVCFGGLGGLPVAPALFALGIDEVPMEAGISAPQRVSREAWGR